MMIARYSDGSEERVTARGIRDALRKLAEKYPPSGSKPGGAEIMSVRREKPRAVVTLAPGDKPAVIRLLNDDGDLVQEFTVTPRGAVTDAGGYAWEREDTDHERANLLGGEES